jgi:hypothetical protein
LPQLTRVTEFEGAFFTTPVSVNARPYSING